MRILLVAVLFGLINQQVFGQYNVNKEAETKRGIVVSAHPAASAAGLAVLNAGGNAYDAAIAVEFALAVCFPVAGNLGGGGFAVCRTKDGKVSVLNYREKAPSKATENMFQDKHGKVIDSLLSIGALSVGVPGTVPGMRALHKQYGKLPWALLLAPAFQLAEEGFPLTSIDADLLNRFRKGFQIANTWQVPFLREDRPWQQGDTLKQPDLAHTIDQLAKTPDHFYQTEFATLLEAEMKRQHGFITAADVRNYKPQQILPIRTEYQATNGKRYRLYAPGPPSSGGIIQKQVLSYLQQAPMAERKLHHHDFDWNAQQLVEAERLAYADRAKYLGDPDFVKVPVQGLTSSGYIKSRYEGPYTGQAKKSVEIKAGQLNEHNETTHYTVVDAQGNAIAVTTTLNGAFGSKVVVKGLGVLLNNEMDDFSAKPGSPNAYGLIGGSANAIAPNKRMVSSMCPTIVEALEKGKPARLAYTIGTPGGSTIPTSVLQTFLNMVEGEMLSPAKAVAKPRYHHQWLPDEVQTESGAIPTTSTLPQKGYKLVQRDKIGRVEAIQIMPDGTRIGGADPRGDDAVMVQP